MDDLRSLQHDVWKGANFGGSLLSRGHHFYFYFSNGETVEQSSCSPLLVSRLEGWQHNIQVVTELHNAIDAARWKRPWICSWNSKNNFLIPFWNAKSCNSRLPLVVWHMVIIVSFLALQTYFPTILGAFISHLWITVIFQQRVCFRFKISDQAYDVRPVLGNNSYPVILY